MTYSIPKATGDIKPANSWWVWRTLIMYKDPAGHVASLNHDIDIEGNVSPSIQCRYCGFHESNCVLEDFK